MASHRIKVTFFLGIFFGLTTAQFNKRVGDSCRTDGNYPGICKYFDNCALSLLTREPQPTMCAWESVEAIVCCPTSDSVRRPFPRQRLPPGALAGQKCQEYIRYKKDVITPYARASANTARGLATGGENVFHVNEYPHMALLGYDLPEGTKWLCGGTLISERHILTAAHCLGFREYPVSRVQLGLVDKRKRNAFGTLQEYRVSRIINHPNRAPPRQYHDIGLLELESPVRFTLSTYPACLHPSQYIKVPTATALGWGDLAHGEGKGSDILQKVFLSIKSYEECSQFYEPNSKLPRGLDFKSQLCAGEENKDTCTGDSGGPLQIFDNSGMPYIIGVTSVGQYCGASPGVYTRVSYYVPWIEKQVWGKS